MFYSINNKVFNTILFYLITLLFLPYTVSSCQKATQFNAIDDSLSYTYTSFTIDNTKKLPMLDEDKFFSFDKKKYIKKNLQVLFFKKYVFEKEKSIATNMNNFYNLLNSTLDIVKEELSNILKNDPKYKLNEKELYNIVNNYTKEPKYDYLSYDLCAYAIKTNDRPLVNYIFTKTCRSENGNLLQFQIDSMQPIICASVYQSVDVMNCLLNTARACKNKTSQFLSMKYHGKDHLNLFTMALRSAATEKSENNKELLKYDTITSIIDGMADPEGPKCSVRFFIDTILYLVKPESYQGSLPTLKSKEWLETSQALNYLINVLNTYTPKSSMNCKWHHLLNHDINEVYKIATERGASNIISPLQNFVLKFKDTLLSLEKEEVKCIICYDKLLINKKTSQTQCHHDFHTDCLEKWVDNSRDCPICRERLKRPFKQT